MPPDGGRERDEEDCDLADDASTPPTDDCGTQMSDDSIHSSKSSSFAGSRESDEDDVEHDPNDLLGGTCYQGLTLQEHISFDCSYFSDSFASGCISADASGCNKIRNIEPTDPKIRQEIQLR